MWLFACIVTSSNLFAQTPDRIFFWNIQGGGYQTQARTEFNELDLVLLEELKNHPQSIFVFAEFHKLALHPEVLRQFQTRYHSTFAAYDSTQVPGLGLQIFSARRPEKVVRENLAWLPRDPRKTKITRRLWSQTPHSQVFNRPYLELTYRDAENKAWRLVPFHLLESIKGFLAQPGWRNPFEPYFIQNQNFSKRVRHALENPIPMILAGDANAPRRFPLFSSQGLVHAVQAKPSSWISRGTFPRGFCGNLLSQIQLDQVFRSGGISISVQILNHSGSDHAALEILPK